MNAAEVMSWQEVIVTLAVIALIGFFLWCVTRD